MNLYGFVGNSSTRTIDFIGLQNIKTCNYTIYVGHRGDKSKEAITKLKNIVNTCGDKVGLVSCYSNMLKRYADDEGTEYLDHIIPGPYTNRLAWSNAASRYDEVKYRFEIYPELLKKYHEEKAVYDKYIENLKDGEAKPSPPTSPNAPYPAEKDDPLFGDLLLGQIMSAKTTAEKSCNTEPACCDKIRLTVSYESPKLGDDAWKNVLAIDKRVIYYQGLDATYNCKNQKWTFENQRHKDEEFKNDF